MLFCGLFFFRFAGLRIPVPERGVLHLRARNEDPSGRGGGDRQHREELGKHPAGPLNDSLGGKQQSTLMPCVIKEVVSLCFCAKWTPVACACGVFCAHG